MHAEMRSGCREAGVRMNEIEKTGTVSSDSSSSMPDSRTETSHLSWRGFDEGENVGASDNPSMETNSDADRSGLDKRKGG